MVGVKRGLGVTVVGVRRPGRGLNSGIGGVCIEQSIQREVGLN